MGNFSIERLEGRSLLAGNVTAEVVAGNLIITGDSAANEIEIRGQLSEAQSLLVSPVEGTTINGTDTFFPEGPLRGVIVHMNGGDDAVTIRNADIVKHLRIDLGAGNDTLNTNQVLVRQNLTVYGGEGVDHLYITNTKVRFGTGITGDDGNDQLALVGGAFTRHARVLGGRGADFITTYTAKFATGPEINGGAGNDNINFGGLDLSYDFNNGRQGWATQYADWIASNPSDYHFNSAIRALPSDLRSSKKGLMVSGRNGSDDLFMYLTRALDQADGIDPAKQYLAMFEIDFASNAPTGGIGAGGSAGDSVYLKAGASGNAPALASDVDGINRLNLDHGDQSNGGADVSLISTIANGLTQDDLPLNKHAPYRSLHRVHLHPFTVQAGGGGKLHLVVGTDSGYEATTTLYYQQIKVHLVPLSS